MNNYYPGGRDIFNTADPDIPGPGKYDVRSPDDPYKRYGFLTQGDRFRAEKAAAEERAGELGQTAVSRSGTLGRRTGTTSAAMARAEDARQRRELEQQTKKYNEMQALADKEMRRYRERMQQAEDRIKDLLRERTDMRTRLARHESELRAREKDRELLTAQLEKQKTAVNPRADKNREAAEQAVAMSTRLKGALEKARKTAEADKRRLRQLEHQIRKLEQDKDVAEAELKQAHDYPRQLAKAERDLRELEDHHREKCRKLNGSVEDARDLATRYMNELGEATVHNTALENELQLAKERAKETASGSSKQLDACVAELDATRRRLEDLERLSRQRAEEHDRTLNAANEHVADLDMEIARLVDEREQVQRQMQGRIRELTEDYRSIKHEYASSVKGADSKWAQRLTDTQTKLERASKETMDLKAEVSELRGILLKKEMGWKDRLLELEGDLKAAAEDYEALQRQMVEQHAKFDEHVQGLEQQAQKQERAWTAERLGILEKLDSAHKDGFKLREALDQAHKDAAQAKANCEVDLKRMSQEVDSMHAAAEERRVLWDAERKELARTHADELAELREERAQLEQQAQDDRFAVETLLQNARDELDVLKDAHRSQLASVRDQLVDKTDMLEKKSLAAQILEEQLQEHEIKSSAQIEELVASLDELHRDHERDTSQLRDELESAKRRAADAEASLQDGLQETDTLRAENDGLDARVQELTAANDELAADCSYLQNTVDELEESAAGTDADRDDTLAHYAGLLQHLADRHRAEKAQWEDERKDMQAQLQRYSSRDTLWAIQADHQRQRLEIAEDARAYMVNEARLLYDELQDEMTASDEHAAGSLAASLQSSLRLSSPDDSSELDHHLADVRAFTRHVFLESIQNAQDAKLARMRVEGDLQELKFMRIQGQIVETAGEMSAKYKGERTYLEASLASARNDYRRLQEQAASNSAAYKSHVAQLEAKISGLAEQGASSHDVAQLESANAALEAQVDQLAEHASDLEARLEVFDYTADDERAEFERQRAVLESRSAHMTRLLEQCEVDMATHVEDINRMSQHIAELESERAIMAEQTQFQINWLKENYSKVYQDLDGILNSGSSAGGHNNLRQRIRYVENLKAQILALKKEGFESSRDRDRFKYQVGLLKSELNAYKEVSDADAMRGRSRARGRSVSQRNRSVGRKPQTAESGGDSQRSALGRKGAAVVSKALEQARQLRQQQMTVVDE
ncbi:hypothetical protein GGF46_002005 [Coemansia sp. RSA 552]|nr:hypothetical protein GGF46_002005 [Coemansia sp. RSA 552]